MNPPHDKRAVTAQHDVLLAVGVLLLLLSNHLNLLEVFEGERFPVLALDQLDAAKATDAERTDVGEVVQLNVVVLWWWWVDENPARNRKREDNKNYMNNATHCPGGGSFVRSGIPHHSVI